MKLSLKLFAAFYLSSLCAYCQQINADSLARVLPHMREDTVRAAVLSDLCFVFVSRNTDTAMRYAQEEKQLSEKLGIPKRIANAYNDIAIVQYYKGDYATALTNNQKALEIRQQLGDPQLIVSSLNKIAVIYQELGDYEHATDFQLRVLKIAEGVHNDADISSTLSNLSALFLKVKKIADALLYGRRALQIAINSNDTIQMATAYAAVEAVFEQTGRLDSATAYELLVVKLLERIQALQDLSHAYNDIGLLYRLQKNDEIGLYYYRKAYVLAVTLGNKNDEAFYAANIGSVYADTKQPDSAHFYLRHALSLFEARENNSLLRTIYGGLTSSYILKDRHDSALHYFALYKDITDTVYSSIMAKQVTELLTKYETEQKQEQIVLLGKQNTIDELTIRRRNIQIGVITAILIIVILLGIIFYNRYRMKQEARLQAEILKQQQYTSRAVITAEELERKRIAGDLHDGIGQMFSTVKMNLSGIADRITVPDQERTLLDNTLALIDESCKEVRVISHQMMPGVLLKAGLSAAVRDFIDKIDERKLKITLETFGLQAPLEPSVETVLYRVIQESVNNVIKHANATTLDIQLNKDADGITVTIEDNGKGFDKAQLDEEKGIGLKSIKARVAFLRGKVDYDTAPGKGTVVAVFIPNEGA